MKLFIIFLILNEKFYVMKKINELDFVMKKTYGLEEVLRILTRNYVVICLNCQIWVVYLDLKKLLQIK